MASYTITNVTDKIAPGNHQPIAYGQGGLEVEYFRVAFTGAILLTDTVVLTPRWISDIRAVKSNYPVIDGLNMDGVNSTVTLTMRSTLADGNNGTFMVELIGRR